MPSSTLYYVHDPMCSWCWAFSPTWKNIKNALPTDIQTQLVVGGLAPDSSQAMPEQMQTMLQATWHEIEQTVPGTVFNFNFWSDCQPRRSTYPACRAVVATRQLHPELEDAMIQGIQQAYYLNARNPSDDPVLIEISEEIGCDAVKFAQHLNSEQVIDAFNRDLQLCRELRVHGFPSLVLHHDATLHQVHANYNDAQAVLDSVTAVSGVN